MVVEKKEKLGIIYGFIAAALWSLWPVLTHRATKHIPPIFFVALVTSIAGVSACIYAASKGKLSELKKKEAYSALFMITVCIVVIPSALLAIGSTKTSGVNTSMLLLVEIVYTVIFTHFIGEHSTRLKIFGALGVFIGATFIVYKGNFSINSGDILILLAPLTYPVGNFYSKKALHHVSSATILTTRFILGGVFLFFLSRIFESPIQYASVIKENYIIIVFVGIIILGIGKVISYESLNRLDISKFISIAMTFPLFSLIVLTTIFHESISRFQAIGIVIMMVGVYCSIKRPSVDPQHTKYAKR